MLRPPFQGQEGAMKRVNRREFAKIVGGAVLAVPLARTAAWIQTGPKKPEPAPAKPPAPPGEASKAEPWARSGQVALKLSAKQEEALKQAIERRDRQLAALRDRTLPYDAEPAFVFRVRQRPRGAGKTG